MYKCANSIWLGTAWLFANSPSKITNSSQVWTPTIYWWWKWAWLLPIDMTSWLKLQPHCQLNPPAKYSDQSAITYWRNLTKLQIIVRRLKIRSNNSAVLMFWYRVWFTALLLPPLISDQFQIFLLSKLTDFPLFSGGTHLFTGANGLRRRGRQTYTRYLPENTKYKMGTFVHDISTDTKYKTKNSRHKTGTIVHDISPSDTRRLSWKRNFTRITTSRGDAGSRWLTSSVSLRDKSKFGSRTGKQPHWILSSSTFRKLFTVYQSFCPLCCHKFLAIRW